MSHYPGSAEPSETRSVSQGPRYPDTATLAAFRRSIAYNRDGHAHTTALAFGYVPETNGIPTTHDYERKRGIGYRVASPDPNDHRDHPTPVRFDMIRREASAMRSRAYARMLQEQDGTYARPWVPVAFVPPVLPMAWPEEVAYGAPYTYRARRDDYVPDGGWSASDYWDDELPRSPLPVTYNAPVTIHSDASA